MNNSKTYNKSNKKMRNANKALKIQIESSLEWSKRLWGGLNLF
jgi:hypothetical protein